MAKSLPAEALDFSLLPTDNNRLMALCGAMDGHLRDIEKALEVRIARRGEKFRVWGEPQRTRRAKEILFHFYEHALHPHFSESLPLKLLDVAQEKGKSPFSRIMKPEAKSGNQKGYLDAMESHDIVFAIGPAGTGKTFLAVAAALSCLFSQRVDKIVLTRPAVEAGERLGYLPGDLAQKVDPYLRPLFDALAHLAGAEVLSRLLASQMVEIAPLAYMRGRTLSRSFMILDEAQNTTREQMKMFLTRVGFDSKVVITGDLTQVDLPHPQQSGLMEAREVLLGVEGIAFVHFGSQDVMRHPLVERVVLAYEKHRLINTPLSQPASP